MGTQKPVASGKENNSFDKRHNINSNFQTALLLKFTFDSVEEWDSIEKSSTSILYSQSKCTVRRCPAEALFKH